MASGASDCESSFDGDPSIPMFLVRAVRPSPSAVLTERRFCWRSASRNDFTGLLVSAAFDEDSGDWLADGPPPTRESSVREVGGGAAHSSMDGLLSSCRDESGQGGE